MQLTEKKCRCNMTSWEIDESDHSTISLTKNSISKY